MIINLILELLLVIFLAIAFHEFGHWIYFKIVLNKTVKIKFSDLAFSVGTYDNYLGLDLNQKKNLFLSGIIFGLLPIIFMIVIKNPYYIFLIPFYLIGCKTDIKEIRRLYNE